VSHTVAPALIRLSTGSEPLDRMHSSIADNVVLLRFVEVEARLDRAISVLKARGVQHESTLRRFTIDSGGRHVHESFQQYRGVLTGLPVPVVGEALSHASRGASSPAEG
jgi:KaiC/GvpD/RAD55 family RecA-like ATPase